MKMYSPFAPVRTSRVAWVASLISVTAAPATAPPLGSTTVPRMRPPVLCAPAKGAAIRIATALKTAKKIPRLHNEPSCRKNASPFITSPPAAKISFEDRFFVVACALEPYYNPVNLEKAATRVKHKEFIQRIGEARRPSLAAHQPSGPPIGHFLFRAARLGSLGPDCTAAHAEPLPPLYRIRCAPVAARDFLAPCPRPQSRRHRSCT